jgi:phenylacetate 2-hydroxylase
MNLHAGNCDPNSFDRPDEFLPERWLDGRKGRTDLPGEGGDKLGVPHLTYGAGRRVCPGIDSRAFSFLHHSIHHHTGPGLP